MMDGIPRDQGRITIERETSGDDHRKRSLISCSSPPSSDTAIDRVMIIIFLTGRRHGFNVIVRARVHVRRFTSLEVDRPLDRC